MISWVSSGNDRGQISQVFLFLMAIITIVATIYLGGKLIKGISDTACDASDVEFQHSLRKELDAYKVFGSRGDVTLNAPCETTQLCFVDAVEVGNEDFESNHPTITNAIRTGVKRNIFLIREQGVMDIDYDERIMVNRNVGESGGGELCVGVGRGRVTFRVEGFGRDIKVTG